MKALIALLLLTSVAIADEKQPDRMSREDMLQAENYTLQAQIFIEKRNAIFARYGVPVAADGTPIGVDASGVIHRAPPSKPVPAPPQAAQKPKK